MLRPTITYKQALLHLPFYAEHYPARVTIELGYYDTDNRPTCIVGHLLEAFGANASRVREIATTDYVPTVRVLADDYGVFYADKRTLELLSRIQELEDEGYTWEDAIKEGMNNDQP